MSTAPYVPTLLDRLLVFIKVLGQALGNGCTPASPRANIPLIALFHQRALRALRRVRRFLEAADPAALNPKPRKRREPDPDQPKPARKKPLIVLPRRFGWVREIVPEHIGHPGPFNAAGCLVELMRDPAFAPLLAICPSLARSLRPLCFALGIKMLNQNTPLPFPLRKPRKPRPRPPERQRRPSRPRFSLSLIPPSRKTAF